MGTRDNHWYCNLGRFRGFGALVKIRSITDYRVFPIILVLLYGPKIGHQPSPTWCFMTLGGQKSPMLSTYLLCVDGLRRCSFTKVVMGYQSNTPQKTNECRHWKLMVRRWHFVFFNGLFSGDMWVLGAVFCTCHLDFFKWDNMIRSFTYLGSTLQPRVYSHHQDHDLHF